MKKLLFVILIPFLGIAQDFTANHIRYTITSSEAPFTAKVARNPDFSGVAVIPETVAYNSKNYIVTAIGESAFIQCNNLTSVTIPNSVTTIGDYVFADCPGLTSVTIPNSVITINRGAFGGCSSLTSVTIPNSVTTIRENAFADCSGLTSVTIPNSVTDIENGAFFSCSGLTSVTIPNSVTTIGDEAFADCSGLTSVTIPNSVTTIGDGSFAECSGLTSVTIPNSVTTIGDGSFAECSGLTSVTIPNSVTTIGDEAFAGCSSLRTVNCHITSPLVINVTTFRRVNKSTCALNVPTGTQAVYQAAAVWRNFSPISGSLLSNHSFAIESALKIYPNPVSEILNIALQEGLQLQKVNFYNTLGQLIKTTNHSEINVSSFAKGNYFVEVMTNQGKATKTIIIQ
ncbi:leucine-rich repeat domain-containing protein [Flavobacterium psychrophilum]|uniref:leucine-rich repeat domain-containing protein n=18 Tax=Flavobacterium psychrophilum TaxID=96345 RepID=UPI0004E7E81C|nr:leucine-rich repeat domain-containing protein [Flavobacterium psychrophilum]AIJ36681.1 flavobacterium repeat protein [Flavobacterium psychrophilum]MCB5998004.1 leucine-rich repeat protein [Flavobacterium psychrophilum]MCB6045249.1 leucine-rich repeat protein [Flavobacterium psychrophilum]MEB3414426.1 leucine-rich repeat domain-containing protein [Flavobacterium psychrophilum]QLK33696.1 leucine-rich repeat domain-containing protein [Flavobacterium psychrophilum]